MSAGPDEHELLRLTSAGEPDVFTVRQRGREIARAVDMDGQDQTRVAVVLSDVGRDLVRRSHEATVTFALRTEPPGALVIEFAWLGDDPLTTLSAGLVTAQRLMDEVRVLNEAGRSTIRLVKHCVTPARLTAVDIARLKAELNVHGVASPLDELRAQNQELLDTLEKLEAKRAELARLNAELEETNRGVVALYKELSEELEETNRGVVALYAELNEKSTELRTVSEAKTRFWSNISHELRAPVNAVVGLAQMLNAPGSDPLTIEQRKQVELIGASGATLLGLVNELLDTAKAQSGRLVPQLAPVDLTAMLLQLRGTMRSTVTSPEVSLVIDEPSAVPVLRTDETMLLRILRNLLSNGLKFTERGEVRLTVEPDGDDGWIRFTVADTGIGIPAEETDRVFEEFHQVRNELQVRGHGTGLGLPYARRLSEILGGTLVLRSELGAGTTVVLRLPHRDQEHVPSPAIGTVLVVDDDPAFQKRIAHLLTDFVERIVHATDGRAALDTIAADRPDVVLLDLQMPGMSGRHVLTVLRQKPTLHDIPVVVVTSAAPGGLDLSSAGLSAALLLKSDLTDESVRLAITEAFAVLARTVPT